MHNTRVRMLKHSAHLVNLKVDELRMGRYQFFQIKSCNCNMSQPLTINEAESWMQGYLARTTEAIGVSR